jgi:hypothetical protein
MVMLINRYKSDLADMQVSRKTSQVILSAVNSSIQELLYIQQKLINRSQYGDEILLTSHQAHLLSKLLEYQSDYALRCVNALIEDNYADKKTALDLIEHYQRLSKRFTFQAKRLKSSANKCIITMT